MPCSAASDLDLHCLLKHVCPSISGEYGTPFIVTHGEGKVTVSKLTKDQTSDNVFRENRCLLTGNFQFFYSCDLEN